MPTLVNVIGWTLCGMLILLELAIVSRIFAPKDSKIGHIDLSRLISEPNGDASISRFQFLVFTFVIALCLFLVVAHDYQFPDVPGSVLALLGISGSSFLVSKGIQFSDPEGLKHSGTGDGTPKPPDGNPQQKQP